ncbi:hypothetical protein E4U42_001042 [Claviceps africana]|uniref:Uncharacterized protein n=1 Tax=Claviceps africana TaxID=83212 RepID=A0A8K0JDL7_9HYPO|nr:hypothetical protein E4U42_001042 [Claviceps africana]
MSKDFFAAQSATSFRFFSQLKILRAHVHMQVILLTDTCLRWHLLLIELAQKLIILRDRSHRFV